MVVGLSAASKGAVAAMTLPMAREFAKLGIRVVSIEPGVFERIRGDGPARLGKRHAQRLGAKARRRVAHGVRIACIEAFSTILWDGKFEGEIQRDRLVWQKARDTVDYRVEPALIL